MFLEILLKYSRNYIETIKNKRMTTLLQSNDYRITIHSIKKITISYTIPDI